MEKVITLIGARRSGKTFLLYQLIDRLLGQKNKTDLIFLNFEDERLDLVAQEADLILQAYRILVRRFFGGNITIRDRVRN